MSIEKTFYDLLKNDLGVKDKVGDCIYPDALPEGKSFPAVIYACTKDPYKTLGDVKLGDDVTFNIQAWSTTRTDADAIADAVDTALANTDFSTVAREHGVDTETGLYATILTAVVFDSA